MLMAHSVEGRFPFLDADVVELANSLPAAYKLRGLDEKHVLKRVARPGSVPDEIIRRPKQPYRAPDALSFVGADAPDWVGAALTERARSRDAGVFDPGRRRSGSGASARPPARAGQFSNADNMALVGVLSTGLLHEQLVRRVPSRAAPGSFLTSIDRLAGRNPGHPLEERAEPRLAT